MSSRARNASLVAAWLGILLGVLLPQNLIAQSERSDLDRLSDSFEAMVDLGTLNSRLKDFWEG